MEQISRYGSQLYAPMSPSESILSALLAAAAKQHIPIASSPLNPDLCERDRKFGQSMQHMRRVRPVTRKAPDISPGLWLLRRKAALAHQRTKQSALYLEPIDSIIISEIREPSVYGDDDIDDDEEEEGDIANGFRETVPVIVAEARPLTRIVYAKYIQHDIVMDLEKQVSSQHSLAHPVPEQHQRRRLRLFLVLTLLSACATLFSVFGFEMLQTGHYWAR